VTSNFQKKPCDGEAIGAVRFPQPSVPLTLEQSAQLSKAVQDKVNVLLREQILPTSIDCSRVVTSADGTDMLVQLHANMFSATETNKIAAGIVKGAAESNKISVQLPNSPWPIDASTFYTPEEVSKKIASSTASGNAVTTPIGNTAGAGENAGGALTTAAGQTTSSTEVAAESDSSSKSTNTVLIIVGSCIGVLIVFALCIVLVILDRRSNNSDSMVLQHSTTNPYYVRSTPDGMDQISPQQRAVSRKNSGIYATAPDAEFGMMNDLLTGLGGGLDAQSENHSYLDIANTWRSRQSGTHFYPQASSLLHNDSARNQFFSPRTTQARQTASHYRPPSNFSGTVEASPWHTPQGAQDPWQAVPNEIKGWETLQNA